MLFYQVERTRLSTMLLTGMFVALASSPALSGEVHAFNLRTIPATPVADEPFALTLTAPFCHVFWSESPVDHVGTGTLNDSVKAARASTSCKVCVCTSMRAQAVIEEVVSESSFDIGRWSPAEKRMQDDDVAPGVLTHVDGKIAGVTMRCTHHDIC